MAQNTQEKFTLLKVWLVLAAIVLLSLHSQAIIYYNGASAIFKQSSTSTQSLECEKMNASVIKNAGHFLYAHSGFLYVLHKIEVAENFSLDYNDLTGKMNEIIERMTQARNAYLELKRQAEVLPYNGDAAAALRYFDYAAYQKKHRLSREIFREVAMLLSKNEIPAIFGRAVNDAERIIKMAANIKKDLDAGSFPNLEDLWSLNETFAESMLFGEYTARVCMTVQ